MKLTRDEIVDAILRPERELADESKPGQQPGGELLGEDGPVEWFLSVATPLRACLIGQANSICGVGHGFAVVVGPAYGGVAVPEVDQALCEVGRGGDRKEGEGEEGEGLDSDESYHDLGISGGEGEEGGGSLCHALRDICMWRRIRIT